jgi:hypothetical protein
VNVRYDRQVDEERRHLCKRIPAETFAAHREVCTTGWQPAVLPCPSKALQPYGPKTKKLGATFIGQNIRDHSTYLRHFLTFFGADICTVQPV